MMSRIETCYLQSAVRSPRVRSAKCDVRGAKCSHSALRTRTAHFGLALRTSDSHCALRTRTPHFELRTRHFALRTSHSGLFNDVGDLAGADGAAALADSEGGALFERDRRDQLGADRRVVPRHDHLDALGQLERTGDV